MTFFQPVYRRSKMSDVVSVDFFWGPLRWILATTGRFPREWSNRSDKLKFRFDTQEVRRGLGENLSLKLWWLLSTVAQALVIRCDTWKMWKHVSSIFIWYFDILWYVSLHGLMAWPCLTMLDLSRSCQLMIVHQNVVGSASQFALWNLVKPGLKWFWSFVGRAISFLGFCLMGRLREWDSQSVQCDNFIKFEMTFNSLLSCNLRRKCASHDIAGLAKSAFRLWNPPCFTCLFQCNFTNLHFLHQVVECQVHCDF